MYYFPHFYDKFEFNSLKIIYVKFHRDKSS